jgi:hypothetical protein
MRQMKVIINGDSNQGWVNINNAVVYTCTEQNVLGPCYLSIHDPNWYLGTVYDMKLHMTVHISPPHIVDNVTACNDGYFHGWIHECKNDGGGPICKYQDGGPVIAARTGPGHCYNTTKEGETCESGNFIPIH